MKIFRIIAIAISFCLIPWRLGFCTQPSPAPVSQENITDRYSLQKTDKIIIRVHFSENYFSTIHKAFDHETSIVDEKDIAIILNGLGDISKTGSYQVSPYGEMIFYSQGKQIFRCKLLFFSYSPVLIINDEWYMYAKGGFDDVICKYMPDEFNKAKERRR